jgi:hypothetical protein
MAAAESIGAAWKSSWAEFGINVVVRLIVSLVRDFQLSCFRIRSGIRRPYSTVCGETMMA